MSEIKNIVEIRKKYFEKIKTIVEEKLKIENLTENDDTKKKMYKIKYMIFLHDI